MTWWRAQRAAIAGLLVAAVAAGGVHFWFQVRPSLDRPGPRYVIADAVELGGHRLSLASERRDEFEAPEGSTTVSVRLRAGSDEDAETCGTFSLSEIGGERVWLDARGDVDVTSDDERSCQNGSASYGILAVFLVPDDATGPFWLDVPVIGSPEIMRFRVDG
ncbi:hypothetical protein [Streptomyces sp. AC495_CC817]|uniref:hypothetical protein n=1 Tax=Streptomyces sp. AC495_CC817 TaxID=2823900 RepID=UPI001C26B57F|nr:hypothetical protein [Streptomyces sp. AC495_CC817]